jgi:putative redox protein
MAESREKVTFPGALGANLAARLELPVGPPLAYALFAHCFTCSKDVFAAARIAQGLAAEGIAVLRFDFTGLGNSEGDFANTNFSSNVQDLVAAADWLREQHQAPAILIGHSLGGAAVLAAAAKIPEAVAVATVNAPHDPAHLESLFTGDRARIEAEGEAEVTIAGRPFRIKQQFLEDIAAQSMDAAIGKLRKALLVFHAPLDDTVGIDNAGLIFQAAKHPKSFVSLDGADHLLTRKADATYVATVLAAWASRYLAQAPAAPAEPPPPEGWLRVSENGDGPFGNRVQVRHHDLLADEPVAVGGKDKGLSPYDFLLAGLGACTAMTLRLYAQRKQLPLERVTVSLNHDKIHAKDCADCETREGKVDQIQRIITLEGELSDEQRESLMAIADKCPVHRTLHSEIRINTTLEA